MSKIKITAPRSICLKISDAFFKNKEKFLTNSLYRHEIHKMIEQNFDSISFDVTEEEK